MVEATGICRFRFAEPRQGVVMPTTFVFFPIIVCGHHSREPTVIRGFRETQRRNNKKIQHISDVLYFWVEATGLEPTTSWSLRHNRKFFIYFPDISKSFVSATNAFLYSCSHCFHVVQIRKWSNMWSFRFHTQNGLQKIENDIPMYIFIRA